MCNTDLKSHWEIYVNGVVYGVRADKRSAISLAFKKVTKSNKVDIVYIKGDSLMTTDSWINGKRNRFA